MRRRLCDMALPATFSYGATIGRRSAHKLSWHGRSHWMAFRRGRDSRFAGCRPLAAALEDGAECRTVNHP